MQETVVGTTESICPVCMRRIPAARITAGSDVYLDKTCPEHGHYRTVIWRGAPAYASWSVSRLPSQPPACAASVDKGCPFDCGLCPEHRQHSCCVLLEVTRRCNLACPVCFASSVPDDRDPDLPAIGRWFRMLLASGGPCNIQLSGGEPTLRDDLPEIISLGRSLGFEFFQLNTNGLRLGDDPVYVRRLKDAGLSCVFLQFDGTDDSVYQTIRGARLFASKRKAIDRCGETGLGVVLVPTLIPRVNIHTIGSILSFAVARMPAVRGVHFQPISYFGRYPAPPSDEDRITIPEVISSIEQQTAGLMQAAHFSPPHAENAYCSFHGNFVLMENGELRPWKKESTRCCTPATAERGARQARQFVAAKWSAPKPRNAGASLTPPRGGVDVSSLDAFLDRVDRFSFCVSGMAFQDAWTLDLERLRECFIHVVSADNRIIPFCAYNITNIDGAGLYRGRQACG